jgi:hypothetical protein
VGVKLTARHPEPLGPAAAAQYRPSQHRGLEIDLHLGHRLVFDRRALRSWMRRLASANAAWRPSAVRSG